MADSIRVVAHGCVINLKDKDAVLQVGMADPLHFATESSP